MSSLSVIPELGLPHVHSGKVRDLFDAGEGQLLMVASDRLSAFDVVMNEAVPNKGRVLTAMSAFWFDELSEIIGNHLISTSLDSLPPSAQLPELAGRIMLCRRAEMLPIECIVRGFVAGSAWKEYSQNGTVHSMAVPAGMTEAARLDEPMFTPDSSRFWLIEDWHPGSTPQGFDKQPVRDFLETLTWDKTPPPPALPPAVVQATADRYQQAYEQICGLRFEDWPGVTGTIPTV